MRISTLYHLLKGKKTASILSYGYFYNVLDYFYLFPKLKEDSYLEMIAQLKEENYLVDTEEGAVQISKKGIKIINEEVLFPNLEYLNQLHYYKWDIKVWQRLIFTTQVLSEKSYKERNYLPIENSLYRQQQLKRWLNMQSENIIPKFYEEWLLLTEYLSIQQQTYIFKQLVGHEHIGETLQQIAEEHDVDIIFAYLEFKNAVHQLIFLIEQKHEKFPVFFDIIQIEKGLVKEESSLITKEIFIKNKSIKEISMIRNLKESTIVDHLIEIYLVQGEKNNLLFISDDKINQLNEYRKEKPDFRKWVYKEAVSAVSGLTFYEFKMFQFSLVEQEKIE
ncbi:hypothetical protein FM121_12265 [Vagococcus fluvialis bH819]|uniref:Helicase Helix-turn-helix domain-containing protein n=2 Tax=Enterococcaceae TaxID=81852 RepID=A0A1X6WTC7_9ENTE|nr:hypothetical protein FM121_12265 [Vagococcus fluvialis bH819]